MREAIRPELRTDSYAPQPVRQVRIAKADKPGEWRTLGIPTIHDRVCQHALLNRSRMDTTTKPRLNILQTSKSFIVSSREFAIGHFTKMMTGGTNPYRLRWQERTKRLRWPWRCFRSG